MKRDSPASYQPSRLFGQFGFAILIGILSLLAIGLTILVPPWIEVRCQRHQTLWWSERVVVHETSFAGFDYVWAKWKIAPGHGSGEDFESIDFDVHWHLLIGEWVAIVVVAGTSYFILSIVVFRTLTIANSRLAEQPNRYVGRKEIKRRHNQ